MPRASVPTATAAKPGDRRNPRRAYRTSWKSPFTAASRFSSQEDTIYILLEASSRCFRRKAQAVLHPFLALDPAVAQAHDPLAIPGVLLRMGDLDDGRPF